MIDIERTVRDVLYELEGRQPEGAALKETDVNEVPGRLEHSLLNVGLTCDELLSECRTARQLQVATVCVAPYYVSEAVRMLEGSGVAVCAAVGLPSAFMSTEAKVADVRACIMFGASEIDLAINVAAVKSGDYSKAEKDYMSAVRAADGRAAIKAAFEHGSFNTEQRHFVLDMIGRSGVKFIKIQNITSGHGARPEEVLLVREILGDKIKIKIDGGVKTLNHAMELFKAGAARIGLTATRAVAEEALKSR